MRRRRVQQDLALVGGSALAGGTHVRLKRGSFLLAGGLACLYVLSTFPWAALRTGPLQKYQPSASNHTDHYQGALVHMGDEKELKQPAVFTCGWPLDGLASHMFPDFQQPPIPLVDKNALAKTSMNDVLVFGRHGPCPLLGGSLQDVMSHFPGKVLFVNGEPHGLASPHPRAYHIGPYPNGENTLEVPYISVLFCHHIKYDFYKHLVKFLDPNQRPKSTGKFKAVAYLTSNCVPFRQQAAIQINGFLPVHTSLKCKIPGGTIVDSPTNRDKRGKNYEVFSEFKFCLVMENTVAPMYITEKIANAFLGGCLPIYYGTKDIFRIFNKEAFVFYDIDQPSTALNLLKKLNQDEALYNRMASAPILVDGNRTFEEFFSLADYMGRGVLKKRIRALMGL